LFAVAPIEVGETVIIVGGRVLSDAGLRAVMASVEKYSSIAVGEGRHLLLDSPTDADYGNHSCDANTWMCDEVTTCARRGIDVGEEITIDYATQTGIPNWSMICNCRATLCRREITGNDWQLRDVQERYRDHFAPFLNERIREWSAGNGV
jgi:hypothetical protein